MLRCGYRSGSTHARTELKTNSKLPIAAPRRPLIHGARRVIADRSSGAAGHNHGPIAAMPRRIVTLAPAELAPGLITRERDCVSALTHRSGPRFHLKFRENMADVFF